MKFSSHDVITGSDHHHGRLATARAREQIPESEYKQSLKTFQMAGKAKHDSSFLTPSADRVRWAEASDSDAAVLPPVDALLSHDPWARCFEKQAGTCKSTASCGASAWGRDLTPEEVMPSSHRAPSIHEYVAELERLVAQGGLHRNHFTYTATSGDHYIASLEALVAAQNNTLGIVMKDIHIYI